MHDFPGGAEGKAIPYGVYDIGANAGWVSVGHRSRDRRVRGQHAALLMEHLA